MSSAASSRRIVVFSWFALIAVGVSARRLSAQTLRIVTYNISTNTTAGNPNSGSGLDTVLQGIGNEHLASHA